MRRYFTLAALLLAVPSIAAAQEGPPEASFHAALSACLSVVSERRLDAADPHVARAGLSRLAQSTPEMTAWRGRHGAASLIVGAPASAQNCIVRLDGAPGEPWGASAVRWGARNDLALAQGAGWPSDPFARILQGEGPSGRVHVERMDATGIEITFLPPRR